MWIAEYFYVETISDIKTAVIEQTYKINPSVRKISVENQN